jgi:hypothetical protein
MGGDESTVGEEPAENEALSSMPIIRIVLTEDHEMVRSGLRLLLENEPDLEVVAEASDVRARGAMYAAIVLGCSCSI